MITEAFISSFSRIVIGLIFTISFINKTRDIPSFQKSINNFNLLPEWATTPLALLFLGGEFIVVTAMIIGGQLLSWGFMLAGFMLAAFSIALISVVVRKIDTSCNCFGSSENGPVSPNEIIRNACFILCTVLGYTISVPEQIPYSVVVYGLAGLSASIFVVIMVNQKMLIDLFHE